MNEQENITEPIGTIVTFPCLEQGNYAFWKINDTTIECTEDWAPLIFMFREDINYESSTNNFIVSALSGNNNMRVMCLVPHSEVKCLIIIYI